MISRATYLHKGDRIAQFYCPNMEAEAHVGADYEDSSKGEKNHLKDVSIASTNTCTHGTEIPHQCKDGYIIICPQPVGVGPSSCQSGNNDWYSY